MTPPLCRMARLSFEKTNLILSPHPSKSFNGFRSIFGFRPNSLCTTKLNVTTSLNTTPVSFSNILLWEFPNRQSWKKWQWIAIDWPPGLYHFLLAVSYLYPSIQPSVLALICLGFGAFESKLQTPVSFPSHFLSFPTLQPWHLAIPWICPTISYLWALYSLSFKPEMPLALDNSWLSF